MAQDKRRFLPTNLVEARKEILQRPQISPLLGQHHIFYLQGEEAPYHARFTRLFRETWRSIPLKSRRVLAAEWRLHLIIPPPMVQVTSRSHHWDGKTYFTWNSYHQTRFWSAGVNAMPDEILAILIAHVLAYPISTLAYRDRHPQYYEVGSLTLQGRYIWGNPTESNAIMDAETAGAIQIQDEWGFPDSLFCDWAKENGPHLLQEYNASQ